MAGILSTIRALFVGKDDEAAPLARRGGPVDTTASPVPADSQEIVAMARDFRGFLDLQDQRQQELARVVASLPQSMGALPELVRQQTRLADLVAQQLMLTRQRDEQVERTLSRITQGVEQQRDVMGLVQQQLDLNHESAMKVAEGVTTLSGAVVQLQDSAERSSVALQRLLERTTERDAGVQRLHTTLQNWMLFVAILSCMTLVAALVLAWVALNARGSAEPMPVEAVPAEPVAEVMPTEAPLPTAPPPAGNTMPALGGAPEPASGQAVSATGGNPGRP